MSGEKNEIFRLCFLQRAGATVSQHLFEKDCCMSGLQQDDFMGGEAIKTVIHSGAQPHLGDGCCLCLSCYHALHSSHSLNIETQAPLEIWSLIGI